MWTLPALWNFLVAPLYGLCFLLLSALALFISVLGDRHSKAVGKGRGRNRGRQQQRVLRIRHARSLRRTFFLLVLSLLLWQATLFLEVRTDLPTLQLWLGRANFAAVVFVAYLALRFARQIAGDAPLRPRCSPWLAAATWLLALVTFLTPLVSAAERVERAGGGFAHAVTTYGPLFPLYLLHVLGCLTAALIAAGLGWRRARDRSVRWQLSVIGIGTAATGGVAAVTNALLPYAYGDFRFCDVGPLATLFFALSVAYAVFVHGLFDVRAVIRESLVYGVLLSFVCAAYASAVFVVGQYLTESAGKLVQFAVLLLAFGFDPLRRFLEAKVDGLLFGKREHDRREG